MILIPLYMQIHPICGAFRSIMPVERIHNEAFWRGIVDEGYIFKAHFTKVMKKLQ